MDFPSSKHTCNQISFFFTVSVFTPYSLDVASLTWSLPNPAVQTDLKPPARSMAISGDDFAASKCVFSSIYVITRLTCE